MNKYHLWVAYDTGRDYKIIEADYITSRKGSIRFWKETKNENILVAASPIERTFIYKIERPNE